MLLLVFSWFFLVEPWFAFSSSPLTNKISYNDASKTNSTFDSVAYFQISKDDSEAVEVDFEQINLFIVNSFTFVFAFIDEVLYTSTTLKDSNYNPISSIGFCILHSTFRI